MKLRDCEGIYKCGKGTDELCRKALCPFYKPEPNQTKTKTVVYNPRPAKKHVVLGHWILDDFSGLWRYVEDN